MLICFNWFNKRNTIAGDKYSAEASKASVDKLKNDISLNIAVCLFARFTGKGTDQY